MCYPRPLLVLVLVLQQQLNRVVGVVDMMTSCYYYSNWRRVSAKLLVSHSELCNYLIVVV